MATKSIDFAWDDRTEHTFGRMVESERSGSGVCTRLKLAKTWELGATIGRGGFGRVQRANSNDVQAAMKFVPKSPGAEREMLFAELSGVRNVVPIIDSGETADSWILVMPLATCSLRDRINADAIDLKTVLAVLSHIGTALSDLDGRVVHRDLKPENVLLLDGVWCLADFGISRYAEATTALDTQKYALTPAYAAPERWRSERATAATDVYALGVIAYELIDGSMPFSGPSIEQFREQHLHAEPPRLQNVDVALSALVDECLYKAQSARPTPGNVLARLERLMSRPTSPGLNRLREANSAEVSRQAERDRQASISRSNEDRRSELFEAAQRSFEFIAAALRDEIIDSAPAVKTSSHKDAQWSLRLGDGELLLSRLESTPTNPWSWRAPAFEVIAHASITLTIPESFYGYSGRAHSLWFCDAHTADSFGWYETAFMISGLLPQTTKRRPFALDPGAEAAKAVWSGMAEYQTAWPATPLVIGDLAEFIDRWASWLADASEGRLQHPHQMPERQPADTWRQ